MTQREQLIDEQGQPLFGRFDSPVSDINFQDYDLHTAMGRPVPKKKRDQHFNQFQFVSIAAEPLFIGLAIVRLRFASHAFLYLYDHAADMWKEYRFTRPFRRGLHFGQQPNQDIVSFVKGRNRLTIKASQRPGVRQIKVSMADGTCIRATIDESTHYLPMSVCTRTGFHGWTYTQKSNARVCQGEVQWQGRQYDLESLRALAGVDWTGGYMRHETSWNWASISGRLHDQRKIGLNLSAGVNETGFSENTLWIDGVPTVMPAVHFQFDRTKQQSGWSVTSHDNRVRLHFDPVVNYHDHTNAIIAASNFRQHLGRFNGEIDLPHETIHIEDIWGLAEDHYARW
ncbi:MAG: hypothetical protein CSH37_02290 [Thalassolituus sp.]|jgi:hypothetical protein|nr:DUF2804 domain-containing protein [Pseudomonadota bacterium]MEE2748571.1 DUF2804 domain-containing protein [Pseudomonadota bacterium]TNC86957.1 MAG: hypothetical protein CSH37_02290 [Thalassolituus sp.]|tara:strand:- start:639 stop:1661 length:1023 start_codon:yes stop_codon:yes gene_type:complete